MLRSAVVTVLAVVAALLSPAGALADVTVGSTDRPSGSTAAGTGTAGFVTAEGEEAGLTYRVPTDGRIVRWSINTAGASAGTPVTLLLLRSNGSGGFTAVGVDARSLPSPLPAGGVTTFTIGTPIEVLAGDRLGLYQAKTTTASSSFYGGSTSSSSSTTGGPGDSQPTTGAVLSTSFTQAGVRLNASAVVAPPRSDLSMTQSAGPDPAEIGDLAQFAGVVRNASTAPVTATVSDVVPDGLTVVSAISAGGSCAVVGRNVSCPLGTVAAKSSAPVVITVSSAIAGTFANTMSVAGPFDDPDAANNSAAAKLNVVARSAGSGTTGPAGTTGTPGSSSPGVGDGPFKCLVPPLRGVPLKTARKVLALLKCRTGKITRKRSRTVRKGNVIRTRPGQPATLALNSPVRLVVSKGARKRRS